MRGSEVEADPVWFPALAYPSVCVINGDLVLPFPQDCFDVEIRRAAFSSGAAAIITASAAFHSNLMLHEGSHLLGLCA